MPDETLFQGCRFRVVRKQQQGVSGRTLFREVVIHPGAVVIVPVLQDGRICLIKNYRVSVDETLWELPAGTLEPDEDPLECALRETKEETGYIAGKMEFLQTFYMSPGILNERMHLFVARDLNQGDQELEDGEQIETVPLPPRECLELVDRGEIRDAKTLAGLLIYERRQRSADT